MIGDSFQDGGLVRRRPVASCRLASVCGEPYVFRKEDDSTLSSSRAFSLKKLTVVG